MTRNLHGYKLSNRLKMDKRLKDLFTHHFPFYMTQFNFYLNYKYKNVCQSMFFKKIKRHKHILHLIFITIEVWLNPSNKTIKHVNKVKWTKESFEAPCFLVSSSTTACLGVLFFFKKGLYLVMLRTGKHFRNRHSQYHH